MRSHEVLPTFSIFIVLIGFPIGSHAKYAQAPLGDFLQEPEEELQEGTFHQEDKTTGVASRILAEAKATNITANSSLVEAEWNHDFNILKPILMARGFDANSAKGLCELPHVYCSPAGARRRIPVYAKALMGEWIGHEYILSLPVKDQSKPAALDPTLCDLKRVGFFQVFVNSGAMPPGLERLPRNKMIWIAGNNTHGLEGGLPSGFWSAKTRMFLMGHMGPQFTAHLPAKAPMCDHLDFRLLMYYMPKLTGDIAAFSSCSKLKYVSIFANPLLSGNIWNTALGWTDIDELYVGQGLFSGQVPYATSSTMAPSDAWAKWCRTHSRPRHIMILQKVNGPLPKGLQACANLMLSLTVTNSFITGHFPLDFRNNPVIGGISLANNFFTGPLPEIPNHTTSLDVYNNRWEGDIPDSWMHATGLAEIDLSKCEMTGPLPRMPGFVKKVNLKGNRFTGRVPDSWFNLTKIEFLDLTGSQLRGPLFSWGWPGSDPSGNFDQDTVVESLKPSPPWPLKDLRLNGNPLGISAGFLLSQLSHYSLVSLQAGNCSLIGHVASLDLAPMMLKKTGGYAENPGKWLGDLETLDLSNNNIVHFGWDDAAASKDGCWTNARWGYLEKLQDLDLSNCVHLRQLHPYAYALKMLKIKGTRALLTPPVAATPTECKTAYSNKAVKSCSLALWSTCFYQIPVYTSFNDKVECGQLGRYELSPISVDASFFKPDALCRCLAGHEGTGISCKECPENTWSAKAAPNRSAVCTPCPPNSTTVGKRSQESGFACKCSAGYFMEVDQSCTACPKNTAGATVGALSFSDCVPCEANFYSLPGSSVCKPAELTSAGAMQTLFLHAVLFTMLYNIGVCMSS